MDQGREEKYPETAGEQQRKHRILVAPLDWGLGHATRCIPLVYELLASGSEVWIAAEGAQLSLLKEEFPQLNFIHLQGYRAKYARTKTGLLWQMLIQSPKFIQVIKKEHAWLKQMVKEYAFDAVISDNRYGLYHAEIPCIFITHQLTIKSPLGKWSEKFLRQRNYRYINHFTECWVPDAKKNSLAGELSHPQKLPRLPVKYIGALSRFEKKTREEKKNHLLIILSGPEPQRTILENKMVRQITDHPGTATIVRGLPGHQSLIPSTNMIHFYNHLPAAALNEEMQKAAYIISRSGYSTVMDIAALQKKSILIPTPGQTEQEYLATYLSGKKFAFCVGQDAFSLANSLQKANEFPYDLPAIPASSHVKEVVQQFIATLK
ncbi:MAG TPA: glycosyltransferase [Chitinophagaceae bacterium]